MATLILSAVGTVIGGPLGGAIGALVGRQIDQSIIGGRHVEGPRLKELSVQTSSYGAALPLHFGRMRAAGTVIWSTELVEHKENGGSGKGRPSVTTYSYTVSFAVALASRPIGGIGRIWADGNLLRGAAGDLKVGGTLRIHNGFGDQALDPLLAQAEGAERCPAYRHCAYVVFEDLELADFGNRLPSLTFEILGDAEGCSVEAIVQTILPEARTEALGLQFAGFSIDQGTIGDTLATISEASPLACHSSGDRLVVRPAEAAFPAVPVMLPLPASSTDSQAERAKVEGWSRKREPLPRTRQCGLRYYDTGRDYQPGLQRSIGRTEQGELTMIELPAALSAPEARAIANAAGRRFARPTDTISYRVTEIDPALVPGAFVRLPIAAGLWRIVQWEWQRDGVLLELQACTGRDTPATASPTADPGRSNAALDVLPVPTELMAFELPWDGLADGGTPKLFAASSAATAGWTGASLFVEPDGSGATLVPLGSTGRTRAVMGRTQTALGVTSPLLIDRSSVLAVRLTGSDQSLQSATLPQLFQGANRALVGSEIIQFTVAELLGSGIWQLSGLLRGRGGTEWAIGSHAADEHFVLLDEALVALSPGMIGDAATATIVAVGLGDATAVSAPIACVGATLQPLSPVHGTITQTTDGALDLAWKRRARGAWTWPNSIEAPLNEEAELYDIGYGDETSPAVRWQVASPALSISAAQAATLSTLGGAPQFCIRQLGRGLPSVPLIIPFPA